MKEQVSKIKTFILMVHGLLPAIVGWVVESMIIDESNTLIGFVVFAVIWVTLFTTTKPFFYKLASKY